MWTHTVLLPHILRSVPDFMPWQGKMLVITIKRKKNLQDNMYDITYFVFIDSDDIKKIGTIFKLLIVVILEKWNYWKVGEIPFVLFCFFLIFPAWIIPVLWPKVFLLKVKVKMNERWRMWERKRRNQLQDI